MVYSCRLGALMALMITVGVASGAVERTDNLRLTFEFANTPFGSMHIKARDNGSRYAANAIFTTSGLIDMIMDVRYDATVRGAVRATLPRPQHYNESERRRRKQSELVISYGDKALTVSRDGVTTREEIATRTVESSSS